MAAIGAAVVAGIQTGLIDASELPKWLKGVAGLLSVMGTAGVGLFARDNNKSSEQVGAGANKRSDDPNQGKLFLAFFCFTLALALCCLFSGCARFKSVQVKTEPDGTRIESRQSITTFWDSQSTVSKLRASTTDKTQGLTVGSVSEASEASNAVSIVESAIGAAVSAAVKAAK